MLYVNFALVQSQLNLWFNSSPTDNLPVWTLNILAVSVSPGNLVILVPPIVKKTYV